MRIAQVAPPLETAPPTGYGGTERVIHTLTEELVRRGHEVTLFASSDSRTSARQVPTVEQGCLAPQASVPRLCCLLANRAWQGLAGDRRL
jgi:hypothetical protein